MKPKNLERKVWPLGSLYYLGIIEKAPDGSPEELPKKLVKATKARLAGDRSEELPSLIELKVIALDILGYYSRQRMPMPAHMTMLLGLLMGLSEAQVKNPDKALEWQGAGRPSKASAARDIAFFIDVYHWRVHGEMMSLRQLSMAVAKRLELPLAKSVAPASLRAWREEYVNIFDMKGAAKFG